MRDYKASKQIPGIPEHCQVEVQLSGKKRLSKAMPPKRKTKIYNAIMKHKSVRISV
jgi:hypothetical protein